MPTLLLCLKRSRRVENTNMIQTWILPVLESMDLALYEMKWRQERSMKILQIAIMRRDGSMDIDTCAVVSEKISALLDEKNVIQHEYFLEISSPGAERELRCEEDIIHALGEYVYIKFLNPKAGRNEIYGTLEEVHEAVLKLTYMDKAVKRKIDVDKENIALIRLAVKI